MSEWVGYFGMASIALTLSAFAFYTYKTIKRQRVLEVKSPIKVVPLLFFSPIIFPLAWIIDSSDRLDNPWILPVLSISIGIVLGYFFSGLSR